MSPIVSAEGLKINWVNYHTRVKDVYFRMDTSPRSAFISISMEHADPAVQELFFHQFEEFKSLLHDILGEQWNWQMHDEVDGKIVSRIYKGLPGVSVLNKDQWSELISFFQPRIIALDLFWADAKYSFEALK
jgi:hypothetical protein